MNLITMFRRFPDQQSCIEHLEAVRWGDDPHCPKCGSVKVARKCEGDRVGRWNCHECHVSYNVLSGTIFEKNYRNGSRGMPDLTQPTALYLQHRIRAAMAANQASLLHGIVEADEAYVGGKPRKGNKRDDDTPSPRGRGTKKTPVIGAVERGGNVTARVATDLTGKGILRFIKDTVDPDGSLLITDEYKGYNKVHSYVIHAVINHSVAYADGETHTNTIEGFWSLLKRAWYGSHHHYSKHFAPLFIAESSWKYNHRKDNDGFGAFLRGAMA